MTVPAPAGGYATILSSPVDNLTAADPITIATMRSFLGLPSSSTYGGTGTVAFTSVRNVTGIEGVAGKAVSQRLEAGTFLMPGNVDNVGDPTNGTGIAMTTVPFGASYERAKIGYDLRVVGSGTWPLGFKLPGLAGIRPGASGGFPTGGEPSLFGWSGRNMLRRNNASPTTGGSLRGYVYTPLQPADSYGQDRLTNQTIPWSTWRRVEMEYVMNSVGVEGSTTQPADGIHRIWIGGVLVWEKLDETFRLHSNYGVTGICWDLFAGGNEKTFAMPSTVDVQVRNLLVLAA